MLDRESRDKYIEVIKSFVSGKITNDDYEKNIPDTKDYAIREIDGSIWSFYDDLKEHKISWEKDLAEVERIAIKRWILFLYTDIEYQWPSISYAGHRPIKHGFMDRLFKKHIKEQEFMNAGDYSVWPFIDKASYNNAIEKFGHLV